LIICEGRQGGREAKSREGERERRREVKTLRRFAGFEDFE